MIVTHVSPDWDAIGSVWLLQRYGGMADHEVAFVNTGNPDPAVLASANAVVDTGREFDPMRLRFDHHQLPGQRANSTCAAFQVFEHLSPNGELSFLAPLNALLINGDTGGKNYGAEWSRLTGIHALLSVRKARRETDDQLLAWGMSVLDDLAVHLKMRAESRASLDEHTIFRSPDGLFVALKDAPQGTTFAAFDAGARLVLFGNYEENAIGLMRAGEWTSPDCGQLVRHALLEYEYNAEFGAMYHELASWYQHETGFFAGRGTKKAPRADVIPVQLADVAALFDQLWSR